MSTQQSVLSPKPKKRLKFIDMARSIAILLMLEGHFVDDSLMLEFRNPDSIIFATWTFIRGFTAPVFLTVTGLIFVYLLLKNKQEGFIKNIRVRKGFKRVVELFFWGYLLQWYAFHVLECIAVGIFAILILYGLYKVIRVIPLWFYFFTAGFFMFAFYLYLVELPKGEPWPGNAWYFVQNVFHGPSNRAIFPIIPWMGYTMFGAMIGALLHDFHRHVLKLYFPIIFLLVGSAFLFFPKEILSSLDSLIDLMYSNFNYDFIRLDWLYKRLGMVLMELGGLMLIDKFFGHRIHENNLFLKVGQNTLTIYIIHMMVLYGSMIGIGINDFYRKALGPWEVAIGASLFLLSFVILIKYLGWIKEKLSFILVPIRRFMNRIFYVG